ncbi:protein of unknown function [Myxococcus fulvus]|uniref:DUF4336 domain-containing protein n=1 Tax=Myxococcus fulvus TaxID=33 RepID=A0A511T7A0_MYXFU|nr:DUF4336 domain-containing protein [Myxococcus fulvus]GEN10034.1 hypothetical protein MFU01_50710 [Myxococcus fulvus]SEU25200.1 protein of unknown function [Myxococcus fulvus]
MTSGTRERVDEQREWSHGIRPYAPLCTLKPVAEGLWCVDGPVIEMKVGPITLPFPTRMVIIRLRSGGLWLWSPIAPTPGLFAEVDALGPVEHLVSPNRLHYVSIAAWKARYPRATAWASPGVRERARSQKLKAPFDADLADGAPEVWARDIDQLIFRGSRYIEEVVFFHRDSSTLLVADMVIALEHERVQPRFRWMLTLGGAMWPGQTPREVQLTAWGRKAAARACYQRMLAWRPQRVVVGHGRSYLDDALPQLERAFGWLR